MPQPLEQQLKPLASFVEAAGISQVVANLTAGMFSSGTGTQIPANLVTTLAQAGSISALQASASSGSQSVSPESSGVSIDSVGSTGVSTNITSITNNNVVNNAVGSNGLTSQNVSSQMQSIPASDSSVLTVSSSSFVDTPVVSTS